MPAELREQVEYTYWGECKECDALYAATPTHQATQLYRERLHELEREYSARSWADEAITAHNTKFHPAPESPEEAG